MKMIRSGAFRAAALLLALGLWGMALPACSQTIKKTEFTVTLPDNWIELPKEVISRYNEAVTRLTPSGKAVKFEYGFQPKANKRWFAYPYIAVRIYDQGRVPESELKNVKTINLNKEVNKHRRDLPTLIKHFSVSQMLYDPSTQTVWMSGKLYVKGVGDVKGLSVMVLTQYGYVQLAAYARAGDFSGYFPTFRRVLASVVIPEKMRY